MTRGPGSDPPSCGCSCTWARFTREGISCSCRSVLPVECHVYAKGFTISHRHRFMASTCSSQICSRCCPAAVPSDTAETEPHLTVPQFPPCWTRYLTGGAEVGVLGDRHDGNA